MEHLGPPSKLSGPNLLDKEESSNNEENKLTGLFTQAVVPDLQNSKSPQSSKKMPRLVPDTDSDTEKSSNKRKFATITGEEKFFEGEKDALLPQAKKMPRLVPDTDSDTEKSSNKRKFATITGEEKFFEGEEDSLLPQAKKMPRLVPDTDSDTEKSSNKRKLEMTTADEGCSEAEKNSFPKKKLKRDESSVDIQSLPPELLVNLCSFLDLDSMERTKSVSKDFHSAIASTSQLYCQPMILDEFVQKFPPANLIKLIMKFYNFCSVEQQDKINNILINYYLKQNSFELALECAGKIICPNLRLNAYFKIIKYRINNVCDSATVQDLCKIIANCINEKNIDESDVKDDEYFNFRKCLVIIKLISLDIIDEEASNLINLEEFNVFKNLSRPEKLEKLLNFIANESVSFFNKNVLKLKIVQLMTVFDLERAWQITEMISEEGSKQQGVLCCLKKLIQTETIEAGLEKVDSLFRDQPIESLSIYSQLIKEYKNRASIIKITNKAKDVLETIDASLKKDCKLKELALGTMRFPEIAKFFVDLISDPEISLETTFKMLRESKDSCIDDFLSIQQRMLEIEADLIFFLDVELYIISISQLNDDEIYARIKKTINAFINKVGIEENDLEQLSEVIDDVLISSLNLKDLKTKNYIYAYLKELIKIEKDKVSPEEVDKKLAYLLSDESRIVVAKAALGDSVALSQIDGDDGFLFQTINELIEVHKPHCLRIALTKINDPYFKALSLLQILMS